MIRSLIGAAVDDVRVRVAGMILRGVVRLVTESHGVRRLQVTARRGETFDDVEQWDPLGITARPRAGAEALVVQVAPDFALVLAVVDRRHRPQTQDEGETGIYDCPGVGQTQQRIRLRPGTGVQVAAPYGMAVTGALSGTTVRSGDGLTGSWSEPDTGQTLTWTGGILTGAIPALGP